MRTKSRPVYVADFETTPEAQFKIEGRTRVYLWKLVSLDKSKEFYGVNLDEFFAVIRGFEEDSIIYFHNLSFDGNFLLWYLMEHGYEFAKDLKLERQGQTFDCLIDDGNIFFQINIALTSTLVVEIRCSYKLLPYSIKAIGELVGVEKLDEKHDYTELKNYDTIDSVPMEEKMYISNDVEIMRLALILLIEYGVKGITISSSAYKSWRQDKYMFIKSHLNKPTSEHINEVVDKSYRGGLTKVNEEYKGKVLTDVISFDVNSLYPSVMLLNDMPVGNGEVFKTIEEAESNNFTKQIIVVYVTDVQVNEGYHSFIGNFKGFSYGRYSYDDEILDKTLYLWRDEYELFKMVYSGTYTILEVVGFKRYEGVFNTYINTWYERKKNATNEVERSLAKLMLNSLYGKFGMSDLRTSKIPVDVSETKILYEEEENCSIYYYKPIASYITSMARVKTATAIQLCRDRFVYCDTDSIYLTGSQMPSSIEIDKSKLGAWKYEGHYKRFKALKPKCYIKELDDGSIKSSIAGLPLTARMYVNFENFDVGLVLKGVKKSKVNVKGGTIITNIDFSILN